MLRDQVGRTNTYRLNTEHLAAEPILALSRLTATFLDRLESHLEGWGEELKYAAVFGSAATGRMTLGSDIDLFLVRASDSEHDGRQGIRRCGSNGWPNSHGRSPRGPATTAASSSTPKMSFAPRPLPVSRS